MRLAAVLGVLLLAGSAAGAEIHRLEVLERDGGFRVELAFRVNTRADRVLRALTDYPNLERLHPGIVESEVLRRDAGEAVRVRTVVRGCVAFFCRELERVQEVVAQGGFAIRTRIIPEKSDFRRGNSEWEISPVRGGTQVRLRSYMVPGVQVPPLLGPWAIRHSLKNSLRGLVQRLEELGDEG